MTCKFEPGKEYKTRGGKRAVVYAVYEDQYLPIHGAVYQGDKDGWVSREWHENGSYYTEKTQNDLVPNPREWTLWENPESLFMTTVDMSSYGEGWRKVKVREVLEE